MADPFIAEIRMLGCNFPPSGWAFCNGQLTPISQNTALFSLVGTTYGGDGKTTFGLPNLQGRAPMQPGRGPGLSNHVLGERGGSPTVALTEGQMPAHSHTMTASTAAGDDNDPGGQFLARPAGRNIYGPATALVQLARETLSPVGAGAPHNNMQPYLTLNFCIALQGAFPPRP